MHAAVADVARLEEKFSRFKPDNYFSRINAAGACGGSAAIDAETVALLNYARACFEQSDGLFDITSGALRKLWKFSSSDIQQQQLPCAAQIEQALDGIGLQHVLWSDDTITFARAGMQIDFGGIVKEYAADCAAAICRNAGIAHGVIDMGGDMHVLGPHPDGTPWQIRIRHPRIAGAHIARFDIAQGAIASSGDYERFLMIDGERYCHILSPKTGYPTRGIAAVSVVAEQCIVAGSACTIAMLKESAATTWLAELGLPHVVCSATLAISGCDYLPL